MRKLISLLPSSNDSQVVRVISTGVVLIFLAVGGRVASAQQPTAGSAPSTSLPAAPVSSPMAVAVSRVDDRYRIGPGDVLDVRVYKRPQLTREAVRVDGRGMIRMPLIEGEIQAACRTEAELGEEITRRYQKYYRRPDVDVFIKEYNSVPVAVIGAVDRPGRFQLQRRVRLLELIALAGGPTERAGGRVQIARTAGLPVCQDSMVDEAEPDTTKKLLSVDLSDTLRGGDDEQSNPYVQPGDVVSLPEAEQAFVIGNVLRPTPIPLKEPITLTRAIAMAGGTMPDTKSKEIRIIRQAPGNKTKTEVVVDLVAINKRQAEDVILQANDIVEVPTSSGKRFLRNLFSGVIPAAAQLPVQVIR